MSNKGLTKLIEECGEVIQVAGKLIAYPVGDHPDGKGDLKTRLSEEMADVYAALTFVMKKLGLDIEYITKRAEAKLKLYEDWDKES